MRPNGSSKFQVNVVLRAFAVQAEGLKHHSPGQRPGSAGAKGVVIPFPCQALKRNVPSGGRDRCFAPTGLRSFLRSSPPGAVPQAGPSQAFGLSCPYLELGTSFSPPLCVIILFAGATNPGPSTRHEGEKAWGIRTAAFKARNPGNRSALPSVGGRLGFFLPRAHPAAKRPACRDRSGEAAFSLAIAFCRLLPLPGFRAPSERHAVCRPLFIPHSVPRFIIPCSSFVFSSPPRSLPCLP